MFGKHTGIYWWESQARGKAEHGVVEKDYRVRLDLGLGREYVEADEHAEISPTAPEHVGLDPDLGRRGLRAHNVTQNRLAQAVREAGHEPRRPKPYEPQFDLAWEDGDVTWVAEVKSITPQNEGAAVADGARPGASLRPAPRRRGEDGEDGDRNRGEAERHDMDRLCAREGIVLAWGPDRLDVENGGFAQDRERRPRCSKLQDLARTRVRLARSTRHSLRSVTVSPGVRARSRRHVGEPRPPDPRCGPRRPRRVGAPSVRATRSSHLVRSSY